MSQVANYRAARRGVHALDAAGEVLLHVTEQGTPEAWAAYRAWLKAPPSGNVPLPLPPDPVTEPTPAEIVGRLVLAVQQHLDQAAKSRNYDDIKSAALRASYAGPWQAEGVAYAQWMDACWAYAYQVQADVQAGQRTIPTAAELLAELPTLELPT